MYEPKPIDTSDVVLPAELLALTEKIAENVHEVWAAGRIAEGWTYGEKKDNDLKTTPLLVPYDELAESEKEYDRNTALETLKLIVKMGYRIELRDPNQWHLRTLNFFSRNLMPNVFFCTDFRCDCGRCVFCRSERRKD